MDTFSCLLAVAFLRILFGMASRPLLSLHCQCFVKRLKRRAPWTPRDLSLAFRTTAGAFWGILFSMASCPLLSIHCQCFGKRLKRRAPWTPRDFSLAFCTMAVAFCGILVGMASRPLLSLHCHSSQHDGFNLFLYWDAISKEVHFLKASCIYISIWLKTVYSKITGHIKLITVQWVDSN